MKLFNLLIAITISVLLFSNTNKLFAGDYPENITSLKNQITAELKDILNTPVYLIYSDKNLNGTIVLTIGINSDGKIIIENVVGENNELNSYVTKKISCKSLWTLTKYAGITFDYVIKFKTS
jgi:hypothetical protein